VKTEEEPRPKIGTSIFDFGNYLQYFLMSALVVTVTVLIIFEPSGAATSANSSHPRSILGFVAVLGLSLILTLVNGIWRRVVVGRPVKKILAATEKLTNGDFTARIEPSPSSLRSSGNELDVIIANFNIMAAELGSVETLQTDFIANVSHELKTPLAVIQNYATMLRDPELAASDRDVYAAKISQATQRLSELISNILRLNKLDNQHIAPKNDTFLLNEQLEEVLVAHEALWEAKNLDLRADLDDDITVTSDRSLLELAWNNIVSNAIKFSNDGGSLAVSVQKVMGEGKGDPHLARVRVTDSGIGMDADTRRHVFDKFYQGDTAHSGQGNGLGLALVARIVEICGGAISVESELGQGTTFTVDLPL
jgi:signal transduction histidine kinase